ncbi:hypothetical protein DRO54_07710 [Candidatus Bathyarchaeota archaeon]|nr:MAG: hypothetical protein DRO54_07710 [Candidatus Bathyarchaeota archaeon]
MTFKGIIYFKFKSKFYAVMSAGLWVFLASNMISHYADLPMSVKEFCILELAGVAAVLLATAMVFSFAWL